MAISFLASEISDLYLGNPPLRPLPTTATIVDAVFSLKMSGEIYVSVWSLGNSNFEATSKHRGALLPTMVAMANVVAGFGDDDDDRVGSSF
ncbi:hypothetical protein L1887_09945 [Cichorium endivia]|nr:hypothetical protein L1887_09945 [Cichorium endivia]